MVEVTPKSLRLRKKILQANRRPKRWEKGEQAKLNGELQRRFASSTRAKRFFRRRSDRGQVPHFSASTRGVLFVEVQAHSRHGRAPLQNLGLPLSHTSPSRFTIAAGVIISVEPSGRLQVARTSCSNWLVTHPRSLW